MPALSSSLISLALGRYRFHQLAAVAGQIAQRADRRRRNEAGSDQAVAGEIADPLTVPDVRLASRHVADAMRIAHDDLETIFQHGVYRTPVNPGALEGDQRAAALRQPRTQLLQVVVHCAEAAHSFFGFRPGAPVMTQATMLDW